MSQLFHTICSNNKFCVLTLFSTVVEMKFNSFQLHCQQIAVVHTNVTANRKKYAVGSALNLIIGCITVRLIIMN